MAAKTTQAVDIFGQSLGLTDAEQAVLGKECEVFLRKEVKVMLPTKKGETYEPRILIITNSKCQILTSRPVLKIENSFNFLKIKLLECSDNKLVFFLTGDAKGKEYQMKDGFVDVVGLILAQLRHLFPITPLDTLLKTSFSSEKLSTDVLKLRDDLVAGMGRHDASSLDSFITVYGFLCDLHGLPYLKDVASYLRAVYLSHGLRDLNLADFEHLSSRDLFPLVSAFRHNQYFEGFIANNCKLTSEVQEELAHALAHSHSLKRVTLTNCAVKPELLFMHAAVWKSSSKSVLSHLDLSNNQIDDKGIEALCTAMTWMQHGLQSLSLSNCKLSQRAGTQLAQAMKKNKYLQNSLQHFDLSSNILGPDPQGALGFLQDPQTITSLNLSKCGLSLELVFPALMRGCQQHLRDLDLSQNKPKKASVSSSVAQSVQKFCKSVISLEKLNLSDCRLNADMISALLEGLTTNPNIRGVELNLSMNELGSGNTVALGKKLSAAKCVTHLNIANTGVDSVMTDMLKEIAENTSLVHLSIGQNFGGKGNNRFDGLRQLCVLLRSEECKLVSLSIADSRLKEHTGAVLQSLCFNTSLKSLDISGNGMGGQGGRSLVKLLLSGSKLEEIQWDYNESTPACFSSVAAALEHNCTLRSFPLPIHDLCRAVGKDGVDTAVTRIQQYVARNHSDERLGIELVARHQERLFATAQQSALISQEVVHLEDMITALAKQHSDHAHVTKARQVKEEANKILKLTDGLYSPRQEAQQCEAITNRVQSLLNHEVEKLHREFVQENMESMVALSVKTCPSFFDDELRQSLREVGTRSTTDELEKAKKAVVLKTAPELIGHISGLNLDTAALISELIVDRTLDELEACSVQLLRLQESMKSVGGASPSKRLSKMFTFRVDDEDGGKRKKRTRRPDPDEEIDLPTGPLTTDGPVLQHLGKTRPKPNRMHRTRRSGPITPQTAETENSDRDKIKVGSSTEEKQTKVEEKPKEKVVKEEKKDEKVVKEEAVKEEKKKDEKPVKEEKKKEEKPVKEEKKKEEKPVKEEKKKEEKPVKEEKKKEEKPVKEEKKKEEKPVKEEKKKEEKPVKEEKKKEEKPVKEEKKKEEKSVKEDKKEEVVEKEKEEKIAKEESKKEKVEEKVDKSSAKEKDSHTAADIPKSLSEEFVVIDKSPSPTPPSPKPKPSSPSVKPKPSSPKSSSPASPGPASPKSSAHKAEESQQPGGENNDSKPKPPATSKKPSKEEEGGAELNRVASIGKKLPMIPPTTSPKPKKQQEESSESSATKKPPPVKPKRPSRSQNKAQHSSTNVTEQADKTSNGNIEKVEEGKPAEDSH